MTSSNKEDYLKTIFSLSKKLNRAVKTSELADSLKIAPASVTEMVGKLAEAGLVETEPYYGFSLTPRGIEEAQRILRKHRLLERFLVDVLKIDRALVHDEAERLEHAISDKACDRIEKILKNPKFCPHESSIPCKYTKPVVTLTEAGPGQKFTILFTKLKNSKVLDRLNSMGAIPNSNIEVLRGIRKGPVIVKIKGSEVALDRDIASKVYVEAL
ncbi:MAG: metal-dependent transcriptional regulator [Candidatus Altiarchaeota archaeon]|nr:metal-dependent transcriptional regulator [Candidatus Altiarchaeota archaeon]